MEDNITGTEQQLVKHCLLGYDLLHAFANYRALMKSMLQDKMYSSEDSSDDGEILNMTSYHVQPNNSSIPDCVGIPKEQ